jgi:hypothetical protein
VSNRPLGRPFVRGQSGNPGGRKRGAERRFRDVAEARVYTAKDGTEYTGLDAMAHVLLDIAYDHREGARDRLAAVSTYVDRGWGRVKQEVELSSDGAQTQAIDWSKYSVEEQAQYLELALRLGAIADDGTTEH